MKNGFRTYMYNVYCLMVSASNGKNGQNKISFITQELVVFVDTWKMSELKTHIM